MRQCREAAVADFLAMRYCLPGLISVAVLLTLPACEALVAPSENVTTEFSGSLAPGEGQEHRQDRRRQCISARGGRGHAAHGETSTEGAGARLALRWRRHSAAVTRSKRWKALRLQALRRDGWRCTCGAPAREVDHRLPVRDRPDLAFDLSNLQSLCSPCHSRKTRIECGLEADLSPARRAWRDLLNSN